MQVCVVPVRRVLSWATPAVHVALPSCDEDYLTKADGDGDLRVIGSGGINGSPAWAHTLLLATT
jgi:hypothetical protein